jgi:nardilysin
MKDIGMPLAESCLAKIFYIAPVKDRHSLSVTWQIPSIYDQWRSKPTDYLAHLIGHEAKGSLLASLKEKSWVTSCWAGVGDEGYEVRKSNSRYYTYGMVWEVSMERSN